MSSNHKIWDFPDIPIQKQLFYVPGAVHDGGLTAGGARISSPEPGGKAILELQPAFQVKEWQSPFMSWLMSKTNGQIFRIKLTQTPQLAKFNDVDGNLNITDNSKSGKPWGQLNSKPEQKWSNDQYWSHNAGYLTPYSNSLEGSTYIELNMTGLNNFLKPGHVIGHLGQSVMIDYIEYVNDIAKIYVTPPLRNNVTKNSLIYLQPYFLGTIGNGNSIKNTYDASNRGHIKIGKIIFNEVVI